MRQRSVCQVCGGVALAKAAQGKQWRLHSAQLVLCARHCSEHPSWYKPIRCSPQPYEAGMTLLFMSQVQGTGKPSQLRTAGSPEPMLSPRPVCEAEPGECAPGTQGDREKPGSPCCFWVLWQLLEPLWDYLSLKWGLKCKCPAHRGCWEDVRT